MKRHQQIEETFHLAWQDNKKRCLAKLNCFLRAVVLDSISWCRCSWRCPPPPHTRRLLCLWRGLTRHQKQQKRNTRGVIGDDTQMTLVVHLSVPKNKEKNKKEKTGATSHMICGDTRQRWKKHELTRRTTCRVKTQDGNFCSFSRRAVKCLQQSVSTRLCQSVSSSVCVCEGGVGFNTQSQTITGL